ncbi:MAG: hypothetical protein IPM29_01270 [Planctomycetes bacterium]|nr:hypothetical protein [Planctomycetota bacterium]
MSQLSSSRPLGVCLLAVVCAPAVLAQRTIVDQNVSFTLGAVTASLADSVDVDFTADAPFQPDVLREQWWWFRFDGDPEEQPFHDDGTYTESFSGMRAELVWSDLDHRGLLSARITYEVTSTGPASGILLSRLTLTNLTTQTVPITIFQYADVDACDPQADSAIGYGGQHTVVGSCPLQQVRMRSTLVDHWCVEPFDDSECSLTEPGALTLPDTGLPFTRADYTSAFEWRRVVPSGLPVVLLTRIEHVSGPCGPPQAINYGTGLAGINGVPVLLTPTLPAVGQTAVLRLTNAAPNAPSFFVFGFDRANDPIANLTLLVQVGPRGAQFDFVGGMTDPTGTESLSVPVPADLQFCAERLYWQGFVYDLSVTGGLPFAHTDAVEWIVGR